MQQAHEYSHVNHNEEHYADSSTEVESLVGAEKQWAANDFHHTSQRSNRAILCPPLLAALRWVLVIGLQLIIISLLARDQGLLDATRWRGRSTSTKQVGGDITGWSPHSMYPPWRQISILKTNIHQSQHKSQSLKSTRPSHPTTRQTSSSQKYSERGTS